MVSQHHLAEMQQIINVATSIFYWLSLPTGKRYQCDEFHRFKQQMLDKVDNFCWFLLKLWVCSREAPRTLCNG